MNPYSIPPILSSLLFLCLGGFVYLKNKKSNINFTFLLVCLTTFWWQFSWFFLFNIQNKGVAEILVKIGHIGILLLPATFLHFSLTFLGKLDKFNRRVLYLCYFVTALFEISLFTTDYLIDGYYEYFWGFYPKANFLHPFFLLLVVFVVARVFYLLLSSIKKEPKFSFKHSQIEYILVAIIFYTLASIDFAVNYGLELYPIGFIFILIFLGIIGYTIAKYKLMNIRVILTEFLVTMIAFILLIQFILSETIFEYIWEGILILAFLFLGYLLIKSVLNEIKRREQLEKLTVELKAAQEQLEKIDKAKTEFLSITSHQLRTPLSVIKGYISMILESAYGQVSEKMKIPLKNIYSSNERLIKLINTLLDISRIESGKTKAELEKASLTEVIASVVDELKMEAQKKNLYLKWEKPKAPLPEIYIDKEKMRDAILNIIDNAIKYTNRGGITINLKSQIPALPAGRSNLKISISDTGRGMEKEEITQLFESFSRGTAGRKLSANGAGLGLYVAKKFVEMHNGRIWVESAGQGKGSTFYVELPIR